MAEIQSVPDRNGLNQVVCFAVFMISVLDCSENRVHVETKLKSNWLSKAKRNFVRMYMFT